MSNAASIKAFMRKELNEDFIVEIPGIKTFSDDKGNPIPFKIRAITTADLTRIRKACHKRRPAKDAKGKLIFGAGCGLLCMLIRQFGSYPEGCSFAILIMNAVTPLINRWTQPKPFGGK